MRPVAFARFVAPAEQRPQLWRLVAGLILSAALYVGVIVAALWAAALWSERGVAGGGAALVTADRPVAALVLLSTFLGMAAGPPVAVRLLHRRGARTLVGPATRVLRHFGVAAGIVLTLYGLALGLWSVAYEAESNLTLRAWLTLLPLTLAGLLVQSGAEEILFRGYLTQQLAARFHPRLVWMGLPALAFGLMHYDPFGAGPTAWWLVAGATLFGLIAADLTVVTGTLGAAWGLHFANNVVALALVATDGTITGLALYVTPYGAQSMSAAVAAGDAGLLLVAWLLCRRALGR